jgi:hypothetical protein
MVEGGRQIGAAGLVYRRGGGAAVAVWVSVAVGVPEQQRRRVRSGGSRLLQIARRGSGDLVLAVRAAAARLKGACGRGRRARCWVFGSVTRQPQRLSQPTPVSQKASEQEAANAMNSAQSGPARRAWRSLTRAPVRMTERW